MAGLLGLVVDAWDPEVVWLFGSRVRGEAQPDSDWDLLVVVPDDIAERATDPMAGWELRWRAGVRADVVVCGASDYRDARNVPNTLAFEAFHHGVVLYER